MDDGDRPRLGLSKLVSTDTTYPRKLLRRGIDLHAPPDRALTQLTVAAAGALPPPLSHDANLRQMADRFSDSTGTAPSPVVDDADQFRGIVLAIEVERAPQANAADVIAADPAQTVPVLQPDQGWESAP